MRSGIHPSFFQTTVTCACGNAFSIGTTIEHAFRVEACYLCHPFYTGKQKLVDTAGRVDRFRQRAQAAKRITEEKGKHRSGKMVSEDVAAQEAKIAKRSSAAPNGSVVAKKPVQPKKSVASAPVAKTEKAVSPKKAGAASKSSTSSKKAKK
jgi:large subunit ribosomal protein L31